MILKKFIELASICFGFFNPFMAKLCSRKPQRGGRASSAALCLAWTHLGTCLFGCFQTCGPFSEACPHPASKEAVAE